MPNIQDQPLFTKMKPFLAVLFMQITFAIMNVVTKTAMDNGLSSYVFVVYRHATAFTVIIPFSLYFEWNQTPKMTISIFWKILAITIDAYPKPLSLTSLICLFGTIDGAAVAIVMERDGPYIWNIFRWDTKLLSAVYTGIFCSGLGYYYLQGVVMKTRDAVFVTSFMPCCMVIVAVSEYFLLDSNMFLGSLVGACVICTGLYLVIWGKGKEHKNKPTEGGGGELDDLPEAA
ncbi:hypothetical protein MtrunA17_Chr1g0182261 [Medicago truncatula]|uniref:WAT1-related protein n=1 Tax=Medicago truncatula TaxID=3880 RepID=A0A396JUH4_MEDTR|nr:hypothetical protein MtrunA17_Chr1g0182261 [Medicago truncatula]